MRFLLKLSLVALSMLMLPMSNQAKNRGDYTVYAFGYSTNLNDTTQYLTAIQELPGAVLTPKENFLVYRNEYGNQLKAHLESLYPGHEVCAVIFSKKKKSLEKKYQKMRSHLLKMKHYRLTELSDKDFQFKAIVFE